MSGRVHPVGFTLDTSGAADGPAAALAAAFARSPDTFALYDDRRRLIFLNDAGRARAGVMGVDPDTLIGRPLADVWPQMAAALDEPSTRVTFAERRTVRVELRTPYRPDGWVDAHAVAVDRWLALLVRDASDERNARLRVERLQALTAGLSEALTPAQVADVALNAGMSALGAAGGGVVLRVGESEAALVADAGFDATHTREWVRFPLSAPYPVNDAIRDRALVFMAGIDEWHARYPVLAPTIEASGYEAYAAAPLEVDGRVLGAINYNFRERRTFDESDRAFVVSIARQAAQALERARLYDALRASAERFRLASEAMAGGLYDWDVVQDRVERTRDFADIVGGASGGEVSDARWWRMLVRPDDLERAMRVVRDALDSSAAGYEVEYRVRHRDGRWIWVLDRGRIVRDADGRAVRVVGGTTDVTARHAAEEERERLLAAERAARQALESAHARLLEQATELETKAAEAERARAEAEGANRAKSDFLGTMSHELRTPLNAIQGYVELLTMGLRGPLTDGQRQDLERVRRANQHLMGLVTDVLNFARVEAGQVEFHLVEIEVGTVVADLESLLGPQLAAKGLTFSHDACAPDTPDRPHVVRADPEKLRQVLLNLLGNAVKFTDPGGHVGLACDADPAAGVVRLRVSDTGRGIAPDQLARIFEPFVQVDRHRTPGSQQGVGLGLAISRDLARRMGGELTVESALGVGSTFTLTLPRP